MIVRREIEVDGIHLSFLESGKVVRDQSSVVLVHGLMGCAETFVPLMQELHQHLHVIALDLPGAGRSERREDIDASLFHTAKLVGRTLKVLRIEKPILIGHSHGGSVAMSLAAYKRDGVLSLVLLSPAHPYFEDGDPLIRFYLSLPGRIFAYAMPWFPQWVQMVGLHRMAGPHNEDTPERLRPYRENLRTRGTVLHLLRLLRTWNKDMSGLHHALRRPLRIPSLILWGDCDRAVPLQSAGQLRLRLLHSELITLQGVGHRPAEEVPHLVAGFIHAWIERSIEVVAASEAARYRPNSSVSQARIAPLIVSSLDAGD